MFSGGRIPYPGVSPVDLPKKLEEGTRLDYPSNAANTPEMLVLILKVYQFFIDFAFGMPAALLLYTIAGRHCQGIGQLLRS